TSVRIFTSDGSDAGGRAGLTTPSGARAPRPTVACGAEPNPTDPQPTCHTPVVGSGRRDARAPGRGLPPRPPSRWPPGPIMPERPAAGRRFASADPRGAEASPPATTSADQLAYRRDHLRQALLRVG